MSKEKLPRIPMFTKSTLKTRGWTDSLINAYLPTPDLIKKNPNYSKGPDMRLYIEEKVIQIENSEQFKISQQKLLKRREGAKKAVKTKRDNLIEYVKNVDIEVEVLPKQELIQWACANYNDFREGRDNNGEPEATEKSNKLFLERICVNFIRHQLTEYDSELDEIFGKCGKDEGYWLLRDKIFSEIKKCYPYLSSECDRQN